MRLKIGNFFYDEDGSRVCPNCGNHGVSEKTERYIADGSIMEYSCYNCTFFEHHFLSTLDDQRHYRVWKEFVHDEKVEDWEIPELADFEGRTR